MNLPGVQHHHITTNGIHMHVAEAGEGRPVVLLHGFPACWYSWKHQLAALAAAGFRAIAPDMRGYGETDAPLQVRDYRGRELIADIAGLLESIGEPCYLVGHDWGGVTAWRVAAEQPNLLRGLAILNAPHPARFAEVVRRRPRQMLRSSYTLMFQLPWLPEALLSAGDFRILERAWRREPRTPGAIADDDIAHYKAALRAHGLRGPLNYYRAAFRYGSDWFPPAKQTVEVPTLLIWGEHDPYLGVELTERLDRWVPHLRIERIANCGHWVQNDAAEVVNKLLVNDLAMR